MPLVIVKDRVCKSKPHPRKRKPAKKRANWKPAVRKHRARPAPKKKQRNTKKWKEYTLYPGGITFPTASDARAALIDERRRWPVAYVTTPSGKRLKVAKAANQRRTRRR